MRATALRAASAAARASCPPRAGYLSCPRSLRAYSTSSVSRNATQPLPRRDFHATAPEDVLETTPDFSEFVKPFGALDTFPHRHIGPSAAAAAEMLAALDPP